MAAIHETPLATSSSQDDEYESVLCKSTALLQQLQQKRALTTTAAALTTRTVTTTASTTAAMSPMANETAMTHIVSHDRRTGASEAGSLQEAKDVLFHRLCELYTLLHIVYS